MSILSNLPELRGRYLERSDRSANCLSVWKCVCPYLERARERCPLSAIQVLTALSAGPDGLALFQECPWSLVKILGLAQYRKVPDRERARSAIGKLSASPGHG